MKKLNVFILFLGVLMASCGGSNNSEDPVPAPAADDLSGSVKDGETKTLDAAITYKLEAPLTVLEGGTLTIPAGTTIHATGGNESYITVARGGTININGTKEKPVVITSPDGKAGDWGGLVICGKAPTNTGNDSTAEVGGTNLLYGGDAADDSSGSITYLRVEYTGAKFSDTKEFNGISLFGVGSGTTFKNVSSIESADDGIEFFGGTVNPENLVSIDSGDDSIDFADGYAGTITNVYITGVTKAGIEASNNGDDGNKTPVTKATVKNVSILKGEGETFTASEGAIYYKEGGGEITFENVYVDGIALIVKVDANDTPATTRITNNKLVVNPIQFADESIAGFDLGQAAVITKGNNTGAGASATLPDWATGWSQKAAATE